MYHVAVYQIHVMLWSGYIGVVCVGEVRPIIIAQESSVKCQISALVRSISML